LHRHDARERERRRRRFAIRLAVHDSAGEVKDPMSETKTATLYRMVLPDHVCPFGLRAKAMLEEQGFTIEERILGSREEVDAFEQEHGVETTPQIFIGGERIGGSDDLERHFLR
jgi:glutaredoxin 3